MGITTLDGSAFPEYDPNVVPPWVGSRFSDLSLHRRALEKDFLVEAD